MRILKWFLLGVFAFYFLGFSIAGFKAADSNGTYPFYWSGLEALWDADEDFGFWINKPMTANFDGVDGPYVVGDSLFRVTADNTFIRTAIDYQEPLSVDAPHGLGAFYVDLSRTADTPAAEYSLPSKLIAISDIEGNFNAFHGFLLKNGVINEEFEWIFNDGHLVLLGDFVDRGEHVLPVLWLIYKLEHEAKQHGGFVHFLLGNHEFMNFQGNWRYNKRKYIRAAQEISSYQLWDDAIRFMYSNRTFLGKWLRSKNVMLKVGDFIFIHGGLSPLLVDCQVEMGEINRNYRRFSENLEETTATDSLTQLLMGSNGPLWYRGLGADPERISSKELDEILAFYSAQKIVVGHTVVDQVTAAMQKRIVKIDVKHGVERFSSQTQGLLIENNRLYYIDGTGRKTML
ncbi:MAG: metallophosphoesterase [Salinivirgaceae bacterium]